MRLYASNRSTLVLASKLSGLNGYAWFPGGSTPVFSPLNPGPEEIARWIPPNSRNS
jgi:hypothetical protein